MTSHSYAINARMAAGLSSVACWLCMAALLAVVVTHHPANHIALDIRVCYVLGGMALLAAALGRAGRALSGALLAVTVASGLALVAMVFVFDFYNVVVGYDVWIARGQPGFGATTP